MQKTDPTSSTPSVASTDEPVKDARPPMPPTPPEKELRLFGGGTTDHYATLGRVSSVEAALNAALHRLRVRIDTVLSCRPTWRPFSADTSPAEVA